MEKEVATEEEEEIEGAMNLKDLFSKEEDSLIDSLDDTQEENSRLSPSKEERQTSGQVDEEEKEIQGGMKLEDLFSEEKDSLDDTQEENSKVSPSEEERQTSGQEDKETMDLEERNLEDLFSEENDSLDESKKRN
ncbi:glutamic acid-rich protein-like [Palaemon carinicauda]|uniref:glutamic acid-rich protein-like n=1 Tax=Palaemon carinicauda TaxID=392227 RepID=UPI0035B68B9B